MERIIYTDRNERLSDSEIERLSKLELTDFKIGTKILYCPKCLFQINGTGMAMKSECPDCHHKTLNFVYLDESLIKLVSDSKELFDFAERYELNFKEWNC